MDHRAMRRLRSITWLTRLLLLVLVAAGCATTPEPRTSPNDGRAYRYLVLDDGLQVLLINDPKADKAAAALAVFRGSYDEPDDRGGLAHFLEHMLFLGTEKYPSVDEYSTFITTHGGTNNAYTAADHTNYFFDIDPDRLEGALDRFAQFFVAPRFDAQYVEREKNAVNSEYQLQLKDDGWRAFTVNKVTFDPDHPGSRFTIGSLETLAGDIREDLAQFFESHYSADQMGLVVLGRDPLDVLEGWVRPRFGAIERRDVVPAVKPGPLFEAGNLPEQITYRTIQDGRRLVYNFPVPSPDPYYREKPLEFIANILGHEGEGSLHALLKQRGWIESLGASGSRLDTDNGIVAVSIELTEEGSTHIDGITQALFGYVELLRNEGIERWRYEEQARIADLAFRFKEDTSPMRYVYGLAPNMRLYPPQDLIVAPYLMARYDEGLIRRYLAAVRPDNVLVEIAGPDVETDRVEPWFNVPYRLDKFDPPPSSGDSALTDLVLPEPNPFIPEATALVGAFDATPTRAVSSPELSIWVAPDTSFGVPRASLYLALGIPGGLASPEDVVAAHLYARLVRDRLNAYAYPAQIAGLDYAVTPDHAGFVIAVTGYDDKQFELLARILDAFTGLSIDAARLGLYRAELEKNWLNFKTERPYTQTFARLDQLLLSSSWSPEILAATVPSMDADDLERWRAEHLGRFGATALMHGNLTADDTSTLAALLRERLELAPVVNVEPEVVRLDAEPWLLDTEIAHDDAAITLYVQGESETLKERALFGLAGQILRSPYFTELRTNQQLGYAVIATPAPLRRTPGLAFLVQSPVAGPRDLVGATEQFLEAYAATLDGMSADEFDAHKSGLVTRLLERDKNLFERSQRYWADLELGFTGFDSRQQIAEQVSVITRDEFRAFYARLLSLVENDRLVVYSGGKFEGVPAGRDIGGVDAFKPAPPPA